MHTYYNIVKLELGEIEHKILLLNTFMQLADKNTYDMSNDWKVSKQYISVLKIGRQNISNNLKTKIANYFDFDVRLFDEDYFYSLIDK